jgi:hypothetical protein
MHGQDVSKQPQGLRDAPQRQRSGTGIAEITRGLAVSKTHHSGESKSVSKVCETQCPPPSSWVRRRK